MTCYPHYSAPVHEKSSTYVCSVRVNSEVYTGSSCFARGTSPLAGKDWFIVLVCKHGPKRWFARACQYCLLKTIRLIICSWSQWALQRSHLWGLLMRKDQACSTSSILEPLVKLLWGSLSPRHSMCTWSVLGDPRKKVPLVIPSQREASGSSWLTSPAPLLWGGLSLLCSLKLMLQLWGIYPTINCRCVSIYHLESGVLSLLAVPV